MDVSFEDSYLSGNYEHTLDQKNRLFIPAKLRDELGATFVICRAPLETPCLYIYKIEHWNSLAKEIVNLPRTRHNQALQRRIFSKVQSGCKPDSQGRLTITPDLVDYARLKREVVICGVGDRVEIWDKETLDAVDSGELPLQDETEENFGVGY